MRMKGWSPVRKEQQKCISTSLTLARHIPEEPKMQGFIKMLKILAAQSLHVLHLGKIVNLDVILYGKSW